MILKSRTFDKKYKKSYRCQRCIGASGAREIVGLLGPNGAGKTTSFYMIVGLITRMAADLSG